MSVLVMGEALVDVVETEDASWAAPGGSPANVALGLGRLGLDVMLHTSIADDPFGRLIVDHLTASGVSLTSSSVSAPRTSSAVATIGADGSAQYAFDVGWAPTPAPTISPRLLHTGSIAAVLEPGAGQIREAITVAKRHDALVTFDPNIRPGLIEDAHVARTRILELVALSDVVKLSDEDAGWLFPSASIERVVDALLGSGPSLVALTRGRDGSVLATSDLRVHYPAAPVAAVDTIGAGDTYMAALIARVLDDPAIIGDHVGAHARWLHGAAQYASEAAAVTVGRSGADLPWAAELTKNRARADG